MKTMMLVSVLTACSAERGAEGTAGAPGMMGLPGAPGAAGPPGPGVRFADANGVAIPGLFGDLAASTLTYFDSDANAWQVELSGSALQFRGVLLQTTYYMSSDCSGSASYPAVTMMARVVVEDDDGTNTGYFVVGDSEQTTTLSSFGSLFQGAGCETGNPGPVTVFSGQSFSPVAMPALTVALPIHPVSS